MQSSGETFAIYVDVDGELAALLHEIEDLIDATGMTNTYPTLTDLRSILQRESARRSG